MNGFPSWPNLAEMIAVDSPVQPSAPTVRFGTSQPPAGLPCAKSGLAKAPPVRFYLERTPKRLDWPPTRGVGDLWNAEPYARRSAFE